MEAGDSNGEGDVFLNFVSLIALSSPVGSCFLEFGFTAFHS